MEHISDNIYKYKVVTRKNLFMKVFTNYMVLINMICSDN